MKKDDPHPRSLTPPPKQGPADPRRRPARRDRVEVSVLGAPIPRQTRKPAHAQKARPTGPHPSPTGPAHNRSFRRCCVCLRARTTYVQTGHVFPYRGEPHKQAANHASEGHCGGCHNLCFELRQTCVLGQADTHNIGTKHYP